MNLIKTLECRVTALETLPCSGPTSESARQSSDVSTAEEPLASGNISSPQKPSHFMQRLPPASAKIREPNMTLEEFYATYIQFYETVNSRCSRPTKNNDVGQELHIEEIGLSNSTTPTTGSGANATTNQKNGHVLQDTFLGHGLIQQMDKRKTQKRGRIIINSALKTSQNALS